MSNTIILNKNLDKILKIEDSFGSNYKSYCKYMYKKNIEYLSDTYMIHCYNILNHKDVNSFNNLKTFHIAEYIDSFTRGKLDFIKNIIMVYIYSSIMGDLAMIEEIENYYIIRENVDMWLTMWNCYDCNFLLFRIINNIDKNLARSILSYIYKNNRAEFEKKVLNLPDDDETSIIFKLKSYVKFYKEMDENYKYDKLILEDLAKGWNNKNINL